MNSAGVGEAAESGRRSWPRTSLTGGALGFRNVSSRIASAIASRPPVTANERSIVPCKLRSDRARELSRGDVEQLLTREDIGLRDRTLWRMLYETAARSAEVLALDVGDLDMPNRKARVRRKGGAVDVIVWQTGTARLLPRLLKGGRPGPCS